MAGGKSDAAPRAARERKRAAPALGRPRSRSAPVSAIGTRSPDRLAAAVLRLHAAREPQAVWEALAADLADLTGARRILLVRTEAADGMPAAQAQLPEGEDAAALLKAISPWLAEARRTRRARLRHGPEGAEPIDQRSCFVAPLIAQNRVLGCLYADIEGVFGRFLDSDRDLLAMLATHAAVALDNAQWSAGLERSVKERTTELNDRSGELDVINAIQRGVAGSLDFMAIAKLVGDKLREVLGAGSISMLWFDEANRQVHTLYNYEHGKPIPHRPPRPIDPNGEFLKTFAERKPRIFNTRAEQTAVGLAPAPGTDWCHSMASVPIVGSDRLLGVIALQDHEREYAYGEAEVRLVQTIASSMGMALENALLLEETRRSLERQTATADILKVIAASPTDVQPVLDAIVHSAKRLIDGFSATVTRVFDGQVHLSAHTVTDPAGSAALMSHFPVPVDDSIVVAPLRTAVPVVLEDTESADITPQWRELARQRGYRAMLNVPMLRDGAPIGIISVTRAAPGPFPPHHVGLLQTFADQAVIAIENVRLFNETKEALTKVEERTDELTESLEYQTAISDVLRSISNSPTDVAPVFAVILQSVVRLFGSPLAAAFRYDGQLVHLVGTHNWSEAAVRDAERLYPAPPNPQMISGRVIVSAREQQVDDTLLDPSYDQTTARAGHWRRMLGAPLLKDGVAIGAIVVAWPEPGSTPRRQIELLKTFADQAVIAIENVRLLNETREALEQQTATAEVLQVISSSVADAQPVFDKILDSCQHLFATEQLGIFVVREGDQVHASAWRGDALAAIARTFPKPIDGDDNGPRDTRTATDPHPRHRDDAGPTRRAAQRDRADGTLLGRGGTDDLGGRKASV